MNNITRENNILGRKFYCKKNTAKEDSSLVKNRKIF